MINEDIEIENQTVTDNIGTLGKCTATNSIFQGSLRAGDDTLLESTQILNQVLLFRGELTAVNCTLNDIKTDENVNLTRCIVKTIQVKTGCLKWTNEELPEEATCLNVDVKEFIDLTFVAIHGKIQSKMIEAMNCHLNSVKGYENVKLKNTIATTVCVLKGGLHWENEKLFSKNPASTIEASGGATLINIAVTDSVRSSHGMLEIKNCTLHNVEGQSNVKVENTKATTIDVIMGTLKVSHAPKNFYYEKLQARDDIELNNLCARQVVSKTGSLVASDTILDDISAYKKIQITRSKVGNALCQINTNQAKEMVKLIHSTICNLTIITSSHHIRILLENDSQITDNLVVVKALTNTEIKPEVIVEVIGGRIQGNIEFRGCRGTMRWRN